jgi:hypothetical protein|tara:strand:+ start:2547 stop:3833 length:1287 start_codon:yes stop_codon:yes gene_type:complete
MYFQLKKNNLRYSFFILLFFVLSINPLIAKDNIFSISIIKSPLKNSFWWLEKNNFGRKISNFSMETNFDYKTSKIEYKIDTFSVIKNDVISNTYFDEAYIKYNISDRTFLRLGKYHRDFSKYLNDDLSSGSMLISQNSNPMPKVGIVSSIKIKKNDQISFDFGIAHGLFDENAIYNESPFLHEKFIYINIINSEYEFSVGLVHEAIWAGSTYESGKQPNNFSDFLRVFISADRKIEDYDSLPISHANALGNHLGIWDFNFKKRVDNKLLSFYYQHFFEDTSGLRFANQIDGLWGLELENFIKKTTILLEYLHTTNQNKRPPYLNDSYYNHGTYKSGWSYKGYTIGNPFISSGYKNINPVNVFHIGLNGIINDKYDYKILLSRKTNFDDNVRYLFQFTGDVNKSFSYEASVVNSIDNKSAVIINLKYSF